MKSLYHHSEIFDEVARQTTSNAFWSCQTKLEILMMDTPCSRNTFVANWLQSVLEHATSSIHKHTNFYLTCTIFTIFLYCNFMTPLYFPRSNKIEDV